MTVLVDSRKPRLVWSDLTLFLLTVGVVGVCGKIALPFLPALTGAATLAVLTNRPYRWLEAKVTRPTVAASVAVLAVTVSIITPSFYLLEELAKQALSVTLAFRAGGPQSRVAELLTQHPLIASSLDSALKQIDFEQTTQNVATFAAGRLAAVLGNSFGALSQLVLMIFILFFFYRDYALVLRGLRSVLPLSTSESDLFLNRIVDTLYATTFGRIVVAIVQGLLAACAFWMLGVKDAILWGVVTMLVAIVPAVGAYLVWVPIALYLLLSGHWGKAVVLTIWGSMVVSTVDNFLYPALVGARLAQHTVLVLVSVLGGIALFGISGLVLGPVLLTMVGSLLQIWKERVDTAESPASMD